jgi:A/G-specific adenine glycosylase
MNSIKISEKVLRWYDAHQRALPWRYITGQIADPYRVWLSEMMLQQTQVDTVIPYFQKFTEKWPTVQQLAAADLDEVLHLWQGLGYYARARNLHKCAQKVVEHFDGKFPKTPLELGTLPGIGPYASAAIAAIAFGYPATVVDGNVARIVSRVFGFETPIKTNQKQIYAAAKSLTPSLRAGDYAQALMDIGSGICTPRAPRCDQCPLKQDCMAYASGTPEFFPGRLEKASIPTRYAVAFVCVNEGHILLRKRSAEKMLGGLWELPGSDWYADSLPELPDDIVEQFKDVKHTFSHFHLITRVIHVAVVDGEYLNGAEVLCDITALDQLALSTLTKKLLTSKQ